MPKPPQPRDAIPSFATAKREFEIHYVKTVLQFTRGNVTQAARIAKKHRSDFHCLLRKLEIRAEDFRRPRDGEREQEQDRPRTPSGFDDATPFSLRPNGED